MSPRLAFLLALAPLGAPLLAAETAAPIGFDAATISAAPAAEQGDLLAVGDALRAGDFARAVAHLMAVRRIERQRDPGANASALAREVDALQDALADRIAADNLSQAAEQERAGKWAYALSFIQLALAERMRAVDALAALWSRPEAVTALGGSARAQTEASFASGHGLEALRWRLARHRAEASLSSPSAVMDLLQLDAAAGWQDADLLLLTRAALDQALRQPLPMGSESDAQTLEELLGLGSDCFGADDPQVVRLLSESRRALRDKDIAALGTHELSLCVALDLGALRLSARTASAATPDTAAGGFAAASASDSATATATAERLEVRLLRAHALGSGAVQPLYGGGLTLSSFQARLALPISDAGVGGSSLTGLSYHGDYAAQGVGLEAVGGVRLEPASRSRIYGAVLGVFGVEAMRTSLGTRPNAAGGSTAASTIHGGGLGVHAGIEGDVDWRPTAAVQVELGLGLGWERLPGAGGTGSATFINSGGTATAAGSESTSVHGVSALGGWLRLGVGRCW